MKTNATRVVVIRLILILIASLYFLVVFGQPQYSFQNATLISGTDKQLGAVYRFPDVKAGTDALVTIQAITPGMSVRNIDRTADGFPEAFQPEYRISSATVGGYIEFAITFVATGTSNPVNQASVAATGLDIDGDDDNNAILTEMNRIDLGSGTYGFNSTNSHLTISQTGTAFTASNYTGILFGALVDTTSKEVMYTVAGANVTTMTFRVGGTNLMANTSNRYASLYYKAFTYSTVYLSLAKIQNFQGNVSGRKVGLNWSIAGEGEWSECTLERSAGGNKYEQIALFLNSDNTVKDFSYPDQVNADGKYYYRLKLRNTQGEVKYSNILAFTTGDAMNTDTRLVVYPSIVRDQFAVKLHAAGKEPASLQIVDYAGRMVYNKQVKLLEGDNTLAVADLNLARGNYVVVVRSAMQTFTQKIIVQ